MSDQFTKALEEASKKQDLMDRIKNLGPEEQQLFYDLGLFGMGSIDEINKVISIFKNAPHAALAADVRQSLNKESNLSPLDDLIKRFKDTPGYEDAVRTAQGSENPYVHIGDFPVPNAPNMEAPLTGKLGKPGIAESFHSVNQEQFPWSDTKFGATKKLLKKHKEANMPMEIHTSSDLIGREDYLSQIPEGSTINFYPPPESEIAKNIFPASPSYKRIENAANKLKDAGHNVVFHEPTIEGVIEATKNKLPRKGLQFGEDFSKDLLKRDLQNPAVLMQTQRELGLRPSLKSVPPQNYADGGIVQPQLVNVRDPDTGEIGSLPMSQLAEAQQFGYHPVSPEESAAYFKEQQYGTPVEQAKTALEGALSAATFGLSTGIETGLGAKAEDILARRETNPLAYAGGEMAGLIGSTLLAPEASAAGLMERAGAKAGAAIAPASYDAAVALNAAKEAGVGIEAAQAAYKSAKAAEPFMVKVGSEAANQAVQFALMQAGDEVSRSFLDPKRGFADAMADVGLSAVIGGVTGGAIGSVNPLFQATIGKKIEPWLEKFRMRANGETIPIGNELETVLQDAPPEVRAAFTGPEGEAIFKELVESGTSKGEALRQTRDKIIENMENNIYNMVSPAEKLSAFEAGEKAKEYIFNKFEELHNKIKGGYAEVGDIEKVAVDDESRLKFYDDIISKAIEKHGTDSPIYADLKNWAERILAKNDIGGLDQLVTELGGKAEKAKRSGDFVERAALTDLRQSIKEFQINYLDKTAMDLAKATGDENVIVAALLAKEQRDYVRELYKDFMGKMSDLASVGKFKAKSWGQLQEVLDKVPSARFAEKLFDKKNIEGLRLLRDEYPDVFKAIIDQKKTALAELSPKKLINAIDALPKEVRNTLFTEHEQRIIMNSDEVRGLLLQRSNPSGTARTLDTLWEFIPMGVGGIAAFLTGGNPIVGMLAGQGAKILGRDVPDAIKLAMLKTLGHSGPIDGTVFKAMVEFADIVQTGQKTISKAAKNVYMPFETASLVPQPSQKDRDKLQKQLVEIQNNPDKMLEVGGHLQQGMPDHASAMAQYAMGAVNYLNAIRPNTQKALPFDKNPMVSSADKAKYNRALDIAQKPLIVLDSVKNGTVTQHDVDVLKNINPPLYDKMGEALLHNLVDHTEKGKDVPYKTRLGLSTFLGSPLDSTMTPQAIMATQNLVAPQQQQGQTIPGQRAKHSFTALNKMPGMYQTPQQARTANKLGP